MVFTSIRSTDQGRFPPYRPGRFDLSLPEELAEQGVQDEEWLDLIKRANKCMRYDWCLICLVSMGPVFFPIVWYVINFQNWLIDRKIKALCRRANARKSLTGLSLQCQWEHDSEWMGDGIKRSHHYIHFSHIEPDLFKEEESDDDDY
mmetsp:Transcript_21682/g.45188  ORF Transcript_21682/g.45188 Transcript_21682/m.45188 type:complete len:147 (-) Transcript_21682:38-478(-)